MPGVLPSSTKLPGNFVSLAERIFQGLAPFKMEDDPVNLHCGEVASLTLCPNEKAVIMKGGGLTSGC